MSDLAHNQTIATKALDGRPILLVTLPKDVTPEQRAVTEYEVGQLWPDPFLVLTGEGTELSLSSVPVTYCGANLITEDGKDIPDLAQMAAILRARIALPYLTLRNRETLAGEFERCGMRLYPHQKRVIESTSRVVVVEGGTASGKTFCVVPWLMSLKPGALHGLVSATANDSRHGAMFCIARALRRLGCDFVFGQKPPAEWNVAAPAGLMWRDVLTLRTGVTVLVMVGFNAPALRTHKLESVFADAASIPTHDHREDMRQFVYDTRGCTQVVLTAYNGLAMIAAAIEEGVELIREHIEPVKDRATAAP